MEINIVVYSGSELIGYEINTVDDIHDFVTTRIESDVGEDVHVDILSIKLHVVEQYEDDIESRSDNDEVEMSIFELLGRNEVVVFRNDGIVDNIGYDTISKIINEHLISFVEVEYSTVSSVGNSQTHVSRYEPESTQEKVRKMLENEYRKIAKDLIARAA